MRAVKDFDLAKQLETYQAMFGALPQSMFLLDQNRNIIGIFNASDEALAGTSVDEIVGNNIMLYANDPSSPFHQVCSMLNDTFDHVLKTGNPLRFEFTILDSYLEASVTKISGNRILSQVRDLSEIARKRQEIELKKRRELTMAMMAGGLTSWSYDVASGIISSKQSDSTFKNNTTIGELLAIIEPEFCQKLLNIFEDITLRGSLHCQLTIRIRNESDELKWIDMHTIPYEYTEDGQVSTIIGSQKDVTEEYEHNAKLRKLIAQNELILNNTNSGFVYLKSDLTVEWENVSKIFQNPDIICLFRDGKLCDIKCDKQAFCVRSTILKSFEKRDKYTEKFQTTDGFIIETTVQPVLNERDEIEGAVLRIDDITEKERSLRMLAEAKELAEKSDKLKSAFLANMSHEIRTPLNAIIGFTQLIPNADNQEDQQMYIDIVNSNSDTLLYLINDILDLSKIEAGYFSCNNAVFNISELFAELELVFSHKKGSNVELRCDIPYKKFNVNLDRLRISQVITNFITNSIKFTKKGHITIGYEVIDDTIKIFVEDTGIGLDKDELGRVFNRFEKFNTFEQGTGLGTSIAKAVVEAYHGTIGAESIKGQGSTFWAIFPINIITIS